MRAYVEAYGCTLNFGESREIEDMLTSHGWELVPEPSECDLAVLVTCVVIETTERAMLKRIEALSRAPRLLITGCMATACREKAERASPGALFVAPGDFDALGEVIADGRATGSSTERGRYSYGIVPIASGCVGSCAYCITRLARGELKSRPEARIVSAVEKLAKSGPAEIQLTAQDTAAYGSDIGSSLPRLVGRICDLGFDFRLRVGMMNPKSAVPIADDLARMYSLPKVFKFVHLPVQSASDMILEAMERGYSTCEFRSVVAKVRSQVPEVTLSTDIIVGYPGETDEDHRLNLELVEDLMPDIVNVTRFSPRPGTKAATAGDKVVGWRAKERSRELTELRFRVALEKNEALVGRRVRALATERGKKGTTILRTDEYKQVVVREPLDLREHYEVVVDGATPTYLIGSRIESR